MRLHFLAATLVLVAAGSAHATPITYTVTDTATGTLGSTAFTNTLITVSFTGDTSDIIEGRLHLAAFSGILASSRTLLEPEQYR